MPHSSGGSALHCLYSSKLVHTWGVAACHYLTLDSRQYPQAGNGVCHIHNCIIRNRFWRSTVHVQMKRGTAGLLPRLLRSANRASSAGTQLCAPPCRSSGANKQQCCPDVVFSSRGFASSDVDDGKVCCTHGLSNCPKALLCSKLILVQDTGTGPGPSPSVELPKERQPPAAMQDVSGGDESQDDGGSTSDGTSTSDPDDELDTEVEVSDWSTAEL